MVGFFCFYLHNKELIDFHPGRVTVPLAKAKFDPLGQIGI